jgi:hypothetical protein
VRMASQVLSGDLKNLLVDLSEYSESDCSNTCCSGVGPGVASPVLWSADCSLEVESGEVETLMECLSCGLLFEVILSWLLDP